MSSNNNSRQFNRKYSYNRIKYKRVDHLFKPKKKITDLSLGILTKIFKNIDNTNDYKNTRKACKLFYSILEHVKEFDQFGYIAKIIYYNEHLAYKVELYDIIKFENLPVINYLLSQCFLKNNKKYGTEIAFNYKKDIIIRQMWRNGKLNGVSTRYAENQIVNKITYLNGIKNGDVVYLYPKKNTKVQVRYGIGFKLFLKKYVKNMLVSHIKFCHKYLQGTSVLYFTELGRVGEVKNLLNFNRGILDGECLIHEHDRVLKLCFKHGQLDGLQAVFTIENKLKCLLTFVKGRLYGRYSFFNSFKKVEEGYYLNGMYNGTITQFNPAELSNSIYPFKNNQLEGDFIERVSFAETRLLYHENKFAGRFIFNDISTGYLLEINIFNKNNFEYRKYTFGKELIIFKKKYGQYKLSLLNLENKTIFNSYTKFSDRKKTYDLVNYFTYI